jgi:hypothetical protein
MKHSDALSRFWLKGADSYGLRIVTKYGFKIRTRGGMMVEKPLVHAREQFHHSRVTIGQT